MGGRRLLFSVARFYRKLVGFVHRGRIERELAEEIEIHRRMLDEHALMGNVTLAKEQSREVWGFPRFESLCQDVRQALRGFKRNPAFTATAVFSLALGIGANTGIFTAVSAIFFKPLAVENPRALVTFAGIDQRGQQRDSLPFGMALQLAKSRVFSEVIAASSDGLSFQYGERAERIMGEAVTPNFFAALGIPATLGESFSANVRSGRWAPEAVLSYSFWKARFGGDPNVVGRVIWLNTYPFTVVGVSPSSFHDLHQGQEPELRIPILPPGRTLSELNLVGVEQDFDLMARLAPGVGSAEAQAAANVQLGEFIRSAAGGPTGRREYRRLLVMPGDRGWADLSAQFKMPLAVLFLLVFLVFLIACANLANMSLARAGARRGEIAVRTCLGAGRGRLVQQMITESLVLAGLAGVAGLLVAQYVCQFLVRFLPQGHIHFILDLHPTTESLVFTLGLSLFAGLLFGLTAAFQSTRGNLIVGLKSDAGGPVRGSEGYVLKKALLAGQIAFSLTLLIVAGLFIRTVFNLHPRSDFNDAGRILVFTMKPQQEIYSPERIRSLTAELVRRISVLPGVEAVSLAENGPFASRQNDDILQAPGSTPVEAAGDLVLPGFFDTVRLPVVAGRDFTPDDRPGSTKVVVINRSLATALFARQTPLGRTIEMPTRHGIEYFQVIGLVADSHYYDPRRVMPAVFFAFQRDPPYMPTLHVRVAANATSFIPTIRREFDAVDRGFPVFNVRTVEDRIEDALARERMIADLSMAFGMLALALAAVGLYGVFAYSVAQRTREIGLRMALGSKAAGVLWLVIRETLVLVAIGVGLGAAAATAGARLLSNQLYGVAPGDPPILIAGASAMLGTALVAVSIPAWRASRIGPMAALRHD